MKMPEAKRTMPPIEPAFQPNYNPRNVQGMCHPHLYSEHDGKVLCRKCGWNPNAETRELAMTNEPLDERNRLELDIPDEGLGAIEVLFEELRERIQRTVASPGQKARALQALRMARTNCFAGEEGPA